MTRGFLIFAHNNEQIDYTLIALCNALMIRANSNHPNVTLVTNQGSHDWLRKQQGELVDQAFDQIIIQKTPASGPRRFQDTGSTTHTLKWHNGSRATAYDLTPYDETILLDADYLIMDRTLDHAWGSDSGFMMNRDVTTLEHLPPAEQETRLEPFGVPLYWATCIYFRKCEDARQMFEIVSHVRENYDYYQHLYRFPGTLFRNDYAFSIAAHLLGGWTEGAVASLPASTLLTSFDSDELESVPGRNQLTFLVADSERRGSFKLNRVSGISVHVMNKFSIVRNAPAILEAYR